MLVLLGGCGRGGMAARRGRHTWQSVMAPQTQSGMSGVCVVVGVPRLASRRRPCCCGQCPSKRLLRSGGRVLLRGRRVTRQGRGARVEKEAAIYGRRVRSEVARGPRRLAAVAWVGSVTRGTREAGLRRPVRRGYVRIGVSWTEALSGERRGSRR
ncbi:hypothetical protein VFPFJ_04258 [Purpureocillium lilacinum]|uniref:Uncharacterized protein n=1 Tax=Purpureocillium lilacinum TaxID=33203 RepID=A0A179HQ91_PURLI|nr:hypothetical protein VFPFJ_04258 [Purpureocillium lilacinum]OAQ92517.1 hypothetical protein VFPFJ_04258 [Purpureocillium lilacinum]